ncbi:lysine transporter LysM [Vibrio sp. AK197]|uniref:LysM-like peptidoglycan-binding domain-containing protein n=1 Tax=Vibrio olivae TaxID=1243002 RepID=A0ABV5HU52_9VIBR
MNRRRKKPKADFSQVVKQKLSQFDWHSYVQSIRQLWARLPTFHQRALCVLALVVIVLLVIPVPSPSQDSQPEPNQRIEVDLNAQGLSEQTVSGQAALKSKAWKEYTVKRGDTLSQVFRNNGLPMSDLNALVKVEGSDKPLSYIKQGQLVRFKLTANGQLDILQLDKGGHSVMFFRLSDGGFGRSK